MKNIKYVLLTVTIMLCICAWSGKDNNSAKRIDKEDKTYEKIEINHIATSAWEFNVENVNIEEKETEKIKDEVYLYNVKPRGYTEEEINNILEKCFSDRITENNNSDEEAVFYNTKNGGDISYYPKSGTLSYNSSKDGDYETSAYELPEELLKEKAEKFIEESGLFEREELEYMYGDPVLFVETVDSKEIERYEVGYNKIPPKGIDGYAGIGMGLRVQFDCEGNTIGFICDDRLVEKTDKLYPSKTIDEIKSDVCNNKNVLIDCEDDISELNVGLMRYVLYCDSILQDQEVMVPHYKMLDKESGAIVVLPAIKDEYLDIK